MEPNPYGMMSEWNLTNQSPGPWQSGYVFPYTQLGNDFPAVNGPGALSTSGLVPSGNSTNGPWSSMDIWGKMGAIGKGVNLATNIMGLLSAWDQRKIFKDMWRTQKAAINRNIENEATQYNNILRDRHSAESASIGARGGQYMSLSQYMDPRKLDPSPIG